METLVEYIVKQLVDFPEEVAVSKEKEGNTIILRVSTNPDDIGKVIGKNGRIASSIRTIVKNATIKSKYKYIVKIG